LQVHFPSFKVNPVSHLVQLSELSKHVSQKVPGVTLQVHVPFDKLSKKSFLHFEHFFGSSVQDSQPVLSSG